MGREIRRVPPHWEHPKLRSGNYHPMYDKEFSSEARKWLDQCIAWDNGTHPDLQEKPELKQDYPFFWQYDCNPPDPDYYHEVWGVEPTWYQVYETVSEGTPVSPPFATKDELINYLVEYGDFWDQHRGDGGWSRKSAEQFVDRGWAPSGILFVPKDGSPPIHYAPRDGDFEFPEGENHD